MTAKTDYDAWVIYRHLWCCILCRRMTFGPCCGFCVERWELLS